MTEQYKIKERVLFGWTDPRVFLYQPPRQPRPMEWVCGYCKSYHLVTIDQCPNCGAPK